MHERIVGAGVDAPPVKDQNYGVRTVSTSLTPRGTAWGFLRRIDNQIGTVITA